MKNKHNLISTFHFSNIYIVNVNNEQHRGYSVVYRKYVS